MCTVGELVDFIQQQLNDTEPGNQGCTWSRDLIRQYILNAVSMTSSRRPDLFTETFDIELKPGCVHYICDHCTKFGGVLSVGNDSCEVEPEYSKASQKLLRRFNQTLSDSDNRHCLNTIAAGKAVTAENYTHGGIDYDPKNPCVFRTVNPVPAGGITATIYCARLPDVSELGDDNAELPEAACGEARNAVIEYVLYQAYEKDHELDTARDKQQLHFNSFVTLLGLNDQATDKYYEERDS